MAEVSLRNVTKAWGSFTAVRDQSLEIRDGEFMVLLGPSGCGKTTTMRMIAGLEEPTAGDILIGGQRVNDLPPRDRDIAMVFQSYGLYPHMTVEDNIGYPLKLRGIKGAERAAQVRAAAAKVELEALLHRRPKELSGGQRQRVALARAIVRRPTVFLMDEPLSNLDAKLRVSTRAEIKHLQHELGVTTVYVTHDQIEAMTLAHRVAVMQGGEIRQLDTPEVIYDRPADLFVAGFIGSPPMNLVQGQHADGRFTAAGGFHAVTGVARHSGPAVLGVRPEDVTVAPAGQGDLDASIYAVELTGDAVLVTVQAGDSRIIAKADRAWRAEIGSSVALRLDASRLHLFDAASTKRLQPE
ncbi:ABC transporter ATP-binding protein [Falsiroseomonas tokyonensis]|uniref:ABC transporter ATP-binding protein n=1 Tax=Falsiroseomonas tokyonensis TaxID=430521 RepID=A0ABV7BXW5_9PROT|nr:ABC transporter ATP-binding protein [Falsiroseomonas tokyonensis]MBU8540374.1 ABC transporter ATP-binding protein [Falsiroseomonas tokyonensis]